MSASIPITLLPVDPTDTTIDHPSSEDDVFKLESVLEQRVVETFLQYSIEEFRSLVRINEAEAKLVSVFLYIGCFCRCCSEGHVTSIPIFF